MNGIENIFATNWIASHQWAVGVLFVLYGLEKITEFLKTTNVIKCNIPDNFGVVLGNLVNSVMNKINNKGVSK